MSKLSLHIGSEISLKNFSFSQLIIAVKALFDAEGIFSQPMKSPSGLRSIMKKLCSEIHRRVTKYWDSSLITKPHLAYILRGENFGDDSTRD
jgi:hypothetical protein